MKGVEKFVRAEDGRAYLVYEVDTEQAQYKGTQLRNVGTIGRRKFENILFLQGASRHLPIKFIYH